MSNKAVRWWAIGRRIQYGIGFVAFWYLIGMLVYFINFYQPPSCFDSVANGNETGVDCGGSCVRICAAEVLPPRVEWVKSFEITPGQYNAVAYVENQNQTAATPELRYTFQFFNQDTLVAERSGVSVLPPNSIYPIFEGRVFTESGEPVTETRIIIEPADLWLPASIGRDQFRSTDINLTNADVRPRLDVVIENTKLSLAEDVEVVATVFSENGQPVTASQTFIDRIEPRSSKDIVFTWPGSIAKTVKSCVIPTDVAVAIDLSGSMNNDGGNPPQPVSAALQAAGQFITTLQEDDQVAVTTFATQAELVTELTKLHETVANTVVGLQINPVEETGYTNTVDALTMVHSELNSERHNPDARRVVVLLTDGLPTAAGDKNVVAETAAKAYLLRKDNIEMYVIGLGEQVDRQFIRSIASEESNAYFAPTGADLATIYAEITTSLCEVGPTKIDVIAKTKTNFAPLR